MEYTTVQQEINGIKFTRKYVDHFVVTEVEPSLDQPQESMYAVVMSSLIKDRRFTDTEKIIILEISALSRSNGFCYATKEYLSQAVGCSTEKIRETLQKMEDYNMIDRIYTNKLIDADGNESVGTYQRIYWKMGGIQEKVVEGVQGKLVEGVQGKLVDKTVYNKHNITNSISKDIGKPPQRGSEPINESIKYLEEKIGASLDGTVKENRQYCYNLIRKMKKDYPEVNPVDSIKLLIDTAHQDRFHSKNATGFKYLYYNVQRIAQSFKSDYGIGEKSDLQVI